ncbi:hypothetical protein AAHA92_07029 [Salvia divinorum]|uniref:Integrase zinc-binding domain-containing protein n=1 Tax=Salvia divinorum TaxID=28513 RepID=A0ABD1IA80_SALDI
MKTKHVKSGKIDEFEISPDGSLYYKKRLCVPDDVELKKKILQEAHNSSYSMHSGSNKIYQDLKEFYWWSGMKRAITEFVTRCLTCQQVKAEHQVPSRLLQPEAA